MAHVVVVGSGIAGLTAAIRASARHDVTLVSKGALADANTTYAQGGVAVALGADDTPSLHVADTLVAGAGGNDLRAVEILCADGPARVRDLLALGVPFDRTTDPASIDTFGDDLARGREAAHARWRVVHADGDATGAAIEHTLLAALARAHVTVLERTFLTDLVVRDGRITGVDVLDLLGDPLRIDADVVVLATGGAGHLYRHTTNPLVATGDGVAAAWRAGAVVADLEFVQFHPTRLAVPGGGLVSEAVRGEGAVLRDASGHRFMTDVHPDAELAPRDVVARGIQATMLAQDGAPVFLDATGLDAAFLTGRFPGLTAATRAAGFDWTREPVPVAPAAHYAMGGISTDVEGRTSIPGLLAAGEAACTGVHGANRLASNSLLEGLVFGVRAADAIDGAARGVTATRPGGRGGAPTVPPTEVRGVADVPRPSQATAIDRIAVQDLMQARVGLLRDADGAGEARCRFRDMLATAGAPSGVADHEDHNLTELAWLTATAALARTESRGAHARTDHPDTDPAQAHPITWRNAAPAPLASAAADHPKEHVPA